MEIRPGTSRPVKECLLGGAIKPAKRCRQKPFWPRLVYVILTKSSGVCVSLSLCDPGTLAPTDSPLPSALVAPSSGGHNRNCTTTSTAAAAAAALNSVVSLLRPRNKHGNSETFPPSPWKPTASPFSLPHTPSRTSLHLHPPADYCALGFTVVNKSASPPCVSIIPSSVNSVRVVPNLGCAFQFCYFPFCFCSKWTTLFPPNKWLLCALAGYLSHASGLRCAHVPMRLGGSLPANVMSCPSAFSGNCEEIDSPARRNAGEGARQSHQQPEQCREIA